MLTRYEMGQGSNLYDKAEQGNEVARKELSKLLTSMGLNTNASRFEYAMRKRELERGNE